jgi:cyclic pyranopterin phosphate synthase
MPESEYTDDYQFLSKKARLSHDEIFRVASIAVGLGVTKLRITGGEPLLDKKVASLVGRLAELDGVDDLALTTNGVLLAPIAEALAKAGLQRVTISLDSLNEEVFRSMSGNRSSMFWTVSAAQGISSALSNSWMSEIAMTGRWSKSYRQKKPLK